MACRHPFYVAFESDSISSSSGFRCGVCLHVRDEAAALRGLRNQRRGNAQEPWLAKLLGWQRVGYRLGPEDLLSVSGSPKMMGQVKARQPATWPGWIWGLLEKMRPVHPDRLPVAFIIESAGAGRSRRVLVAMELTDWAELAGITLGG